MLSWIDKRLREINPAKRDKMFGGKNIINGPFDLIKIKNKCLNYPFLLQALEQWHPFLMNPLDEFSIGMLSPWLNNAIRTPNGQTIDCPSRNLRNLSLRELRMDGEYIPHQKINFMNNLSLKKSIPPNYLAGNVSNLDTNNLPLIYFGRDVLDLNLNIHKLKAKIKEQIRLRETSIPVVNSTTKTYFLNYNIPEDGYTWLKRYEEIRKISTCTRYRSFQFRSLHNLIYSNRRLFIFKIKSNPQCSFCSFAEQDTAHMLIHCPEVIKLWSQVEKCFEVKLTAADRLMGRVADLETSLISLLSRIYILYMTKTLMRDH